MALTKRSVMVGAVVLGVVASGGGYALGFAQGMGRGMTSTALGDIMTTTVVLRMIRKGDVESATQTLESRLDGSWLTQNLHDTRGPFWAGKGPAITGSKMLEDCASYRTKFPPRSSDAEVRQYIAQTVATYAAPSK